jgi:hypothetical protein
VEAVDADIRRIPERLDEIFRASAESGTATNRVADELARRIVAAGRPDARQIA